VIGQGSENLTRTAGLVEFYKNLPGFNVYVVDSDLKIHDSTRGTKGVNASRFFDISDIVHVAAMAQRCLTIMEPEILFYKLADVRFCTVFDPVDSDTLYAYEMRLDEHFSSHFEAVKLLINAEKK